MKLKKVIKTLNKGVLIRIFYNQQPITNVCTIKELKMNLIYSNIKNHRVIYFAEIPSSFNNKVVNIHIE